MSKKIIGLIISSTLLFSLAGCGNKTNEINESTNNATKQAQVTEQQQKKFDGLKGSWIMDFTHDEFVKEGDTLMTKVEDLTKELELEYKKEDEVDKVNGVTANIKSIYLDNKNPEANKLESMQFEEQLIGDAQDSGRFQMKLSLKFDGEGAIKDGKFNIGDTSLAKYSAIMTGEANRNYDEINKKIMDIIKSDKTEGIIDNTIDGLVEEYAVSKNYIVYTISTKIYKFTNKSEGLK